jgi:ribA/ribD-fused uncharacterized protein
MKQPRTVDELVHLVDSGESPNYLFFWGHAPDHNGRVTKSCFSQWWESPFEIDGCVYPTAEHYMMAAKARLFGDVDAFDRVLKVGHPKQAKDAGRGVTGFDEEIWLKYRFDIVTTANEAKFRQNPGLSDFLLSTGDRILVEASPVDPVWGIGRASSDVHAGSPKDWKGLNLLGFALMEVRERIRPRHGADGMNNQ